jgi:hypothetical protein
MSNQISELKFVAVEIDRLLTRYIKIHDVVFKFSWRKIIPLPFIFKPIDFSGLNNQLKEISSEFEKCTQKITCLLDVTKEHESNFGNFLLTYCKALIQTVSLLEEITFLLALKGEGSNKYDWKKHHKKCDEYNKAVSNYMSIGDQLNDLYHKLDWYQ